MMHHDSLMKELALEVDEQDVHSDSDNQRKPTSGEEEFYGRPRIQTDRGLLARVTRGPLAGIDLLHYCRTGKVRRLDGARLTAAQEALR